MRDKWREVRAASDSGALEHFSPVVVTVLKNDISPLMQWRDIRGEAPAFKFDLDLTRLQQQRITGSSDFANGSAEIRNALAALPMHLNQVRDRAEIITAARKVDYWAPNKPTPAQLENLRLACRGLMQFSETAGMSTWQPRIVELTDSEIQLRRRKSRISEIDLATYKANVLQALQELFETNPTLKRIRRNEPVTKAELDALVSLALTQKPSIDLALLKEFYVVAEPLDKIIRSIVGMEAEAVHERFQDFVHANPQLTAQQLQFLQLLQNHIGRYGTIELERLYDPPFNRIHTEGLDGVFKDQALVKQVIELVAKFDRAPIPAAEFNKKESPDDYRATQA